MIPAATADHKNKNFALKNRPKAVFLFSAKPDNGFSKHFG